MTQPQTPTGNTGASASVGPTTSATTHTGPATTYRRDALVDLERPGRWAKQLASHLGRKLEVTDTARGPQLTMRLHEGTATCLMDATAESVLGLHVEATSAEAAERLAHVVGSHLARFAQKEDASVSWSVPEEQLSAAGRG